MSDRPEHRGRPAATGPAFPVAEPEPAVIIVPYRTGGQSAKLLPPLLLVLLGTAFLTYRARSSDWRGASALFESRPRPALAPTLAHSEEPPAPVVIPTPPAPKPGPAEAEKSGDARGSLQGKEDTREKEKEKAAGAKPAGPKPQADPLEDIKREAEKTRVRMAELERLKERESRKLDETARERLRADRLDRRRNPGFRAGRVPPAQLEKMLREQDDRLRRHMELMARMQRRQMEQMAALQRGFFQDRGPLFFPPPPLLPGLQADPLPPDEVFARFPGARGPGGGPQVFRFQFRRGDGFPMDDDPPPPPPPRLHPFD